MNKPELIAKVAEATDITKKQAEEITNALIDIIMKSLKEDKVVISGFGTFEVRKRSKKIGRNPQTGEEIIIDSSNAPVFKAAKTFKEFINND